MSKLFSGIMICLLAVTVHAQQIKPKDKFVVSAEAALLNGDRYVNGQILLNAGYEFNGWYAGAGTGFDYYKYRTVPVFAEVKKYFGNNYNKQFFLFAKGGNDIAWPTENQKNLRSNNWGGWNITSKSVFRNGVYTDVGFGYTLFNSKQKGFYTVAGYSSKSLTEVYNEQVWNGATSVITRRQLQYTLNRIVIRFGYRF